MANLSLKHIYKVYPNGAKAVNDFNMQIDDKEFIVFVGPSGCGKSTTLRMIAGLEEITAGELKIGDTVVNGMEPKDRDIAMVFQNYALYPHMTIFENIAFGLRMRKIPDVKRDKEGRPVLDKDGKEIPVMRKYNKQELAAKVNEAAEILGIKEYLKRKPKEMSGGQRQRVALGRAIVRHPKVMLLDEPLSNLDAKLRTQMRSEIVKLHKKLETTFIYVTHDQIEAMTMGTRIVVMKDGFVKQIDTPKNLYKYPANKFVAGFIGTPQMNFFACTLKKSGDKVKIKFTDADAEITVPYAALMKTTPHYLDGSKNVILGFRAEAVSLDGAGDAKIKVKISHSEELGTETLVYGDLNTEGGADTRIIIKAGGFRQFEPDAVCTASLDTEQIHLFDAETEESIMPRIPEFNYLDCSVKGGKLTFLGITETLPPAISCGEGKGELLIPVSAVKFGGDIKAKVTDSETVNGKILLTLEINGGRLYALSDEERKGEVSVGIDYKAITLRAGGSETLPMPRINCLDGTLIAEKKDGATVYSLLIGGEKFAAPEEVYTKIFAATTGRKAFNTAFRYEWDAYGLSVGESGISAEVEEMLDYGEEKFARVNACGQTLYVKTDADLSGTVRIVPDAAKVSVVESERRIRIV